jgi:pimeloyl-ACP methyl ester carboxylesterase
MTGLAPARDGVTLAWRRYGQGTPVLLLQGQATPATGWTTLMQHLHWQHRFIVFDQRGTGSSGTGDADAFTTRRFAADAASVLDAAGVTSAHVVGHSMGGKVAQWFAIDYPDRVCTLSLLATASSPAWAPALGTRKTLYRGSLQERARLFFTEEWIDLHPRAVEAFFAIASDDEALKWIARASATHDSSTWLHDVQAPTLVVAGTEDQLASLDASRELAARIPRSRLQVLPNARHGLHLLPQAADLIASVLAGP